MATKKNLKSVKANVSKKKTVKDSVNASVPTKTKLQKLDVESMLDIKVLLKYKKTLKIDKLILPDGREF